MRTSRETIKQATEKTSTSAETDWEVINHTPAPQLPPKTRPFSELSFPVSIKEKEEQEGRQTYHPVNIAFRHNKLRFFKYNKHDSKIYDRIELEGIKAISQIEAYVWQICQYLAPNHVPPSTRAYYDDSNDCDLLSMSALPENDLDKIPGKSAAAYVIVKDQLFYVNKVEKKPVRIEIDSLKLQELKTTLKVNEVVLQPKEQAICLLNKLTNSQLQVISSLTNHTHIKKEQPYVGVSSKDFPGFVPNRDRPLKESDIQIEAIEGSVENQKKLGMQLIEMIQQLSDHYVAVEKEKNATSSPSSSYFQSLQNATSGVTGIFKYGVNRYLNWKPTSVQFDELTLQQFLQDKEKFPDEEKFYEYLHNKNKFSKDSIAALLIKLNERKAYIVDSATTEKKYKDELAILNKLSLLTTTLGLYAEKNDINNADITQFDEMVKIINKKGISVDGCDFLMTSIAPTDEEFTKLPGKSRTAYVISGNHLFYVDKLLKKRVRLDISINKIKELKTALEIEKTFLEPQQKYKCVFENISDDQKELIKSVTGYAYPQDEVDNTELKAMVFGKPFILKVKAFRNFCNVTGAITGACVGYLHENYDHHSRNTSKDGKLIDFDKYKWWLTYLFNVPGLLEKFFSPNKPLDFVITENDIRNFPNIQDALPAFGYWLTKQTYIAQSQIDRVSTTLLLDISKNFFTPQDNEVFKKLAIHAVCDYTKYKLFLKFILTPPEFYQSAADLHIEEDLTYKGVNIPKTLVSHDKERTNQLKNVLLKMPEFQEFLAKYGDYVFQSLREECAAYKERYRDKLDEKSYYQNFVDSLNTKECSFLLMAHPPREEEISKLLGNAEAAYVLAGGNQFLYVDKKTKTCTPIEVDPHIFEKLKEELDLKSISLGWDENSKTLIESLSLTQLRQITFFTGHVHQDAMTEEYNKIYAASGADKLKQKLMKQTINLSDSILPTDSMLNSLTKKRF